MHTVNKMILKDKSASYQFGFYEIRDEPGGGPWRAWVAIGETPNVRDALAMVSFLNGGDPLVVYPDTMVLY